MGQGRTASLPDDGDGHEQSVWPAIRSSADARPVVLGRPPR